MMYKCEILADIEMISNVDVRRVNGVDMYEVTGLERSFCRSLKRWMEQPYAREYIKALALVKHKEMKSNEIVGSKAYALERVKIAESFAIQQGDRVWVCREIFIEFARWLSPYFALKCNLFCTPLVSTIDKQTKV